AMNALLGHPRLSGVGIEIRNMQARLVGHGKLPDIPCMVGKLAVEIKFALAQGLTERLIEVPVELIGTPHHRDQIGHVMRYVPTVYPSIVFAVVGARPLSARKTIIEGFDKLTLFIFRMKEAGFCIVKITVVQRIFLK